MMSCTPAYYAPPLIGLKGTIDVKDPSGETLYQKNITEERGLSDFLNQYSHSQEGWGGARSAFCPLRAKTLTDLSKEVFLPTFVLYTSKVENIAFRIIASIAAIAFDLVTLPLRLVITPFRIAYNLNHPEKIHLLAQLIESQTGRKLEEENVFIHYKMENIRAGDDASCLPCAHKDVTKGFVQVVLNRPYATVSQEKIHVAHYIKTSFNKSEGKWSPWCFTGGRDSAEKSLAY